jgi:hypothetical protein
MQSDPPFTAEKMTQLLKGEAGGFTLQFKAAAIVLILFEELKSTIVGRTRSFFSDSFEVGADGSIVDHPDAEYLASIKGKSEFRVCRDFHLKQSAMAQADDTFIDEFARLRNSVSHELVRMMLDDRIEMIRPEPIARALTLIGKIEGWWLFNFEAGIAPDEFEHLSEEQIKAGRSVNFILINKLIERVFADEPGLSEVTGHSER